MWTAPLDATSTYSRYDRTWQGGWVVSFVDLYVEAARYDGATMRFTVKPFVALSVLAVLIEALPALAVDYPTKQDEMDKLCEVIGEAPNLSIPPKDRLWFKENCLCGEKAVGCGHPGSKRLATRMKAFKQAEKARADAEAKAEAARIVALKEEMARNLRDATQACDLYVACRRAKGEQGQFDCAPERDRFAAAAVLATGIHDRVDAKEITLGWGLANEVASAGPNASCGLASEKLLSIEADATGLTRER